MGLSSGRKEKKKLERIESLRNELENNDELFRKNEDTPEMQIQAGLVRYSYPVGAARYDILLRQMMMEIEDIRIMISSGMKPLNPHYKYEENADWQRNQVVRLEIEKQVKESNVREIEAKVEVVKQEISAQNERIRQRKTQIIEELEKLGADVKAYRKSVPPAYIN